MAETFMKVSIEDFRMFAQYIADNNLWDEVEQLLKSQGHTQIRISFDPTRAVAQLLKQKAAGDTHAGASTSPDHRVYLRRSPRSRQRSTGRCSRR
jgi:hypothetical protein